MWDAEQGGIVATSQDIDALAAALRAGSRQALARAITLVESTRASDGWRAESLLTRLLPSTGSSLRIGISGAPGAGKSTFIEALGQIIAGEGRKLAVLAIDPSSRRSGGSILGDKTRMARLACNSLAFIRPTPSGASSGGVARRTRETMLLAEAAGHEVLLVETVGVGQSETAVAEMVDLFVLLIAPGGGDELQGIKRGIMELADVVLITKADGALAEAAAQALADYRAASALMRPKYADIPVSITSISAVTGDGIGESWDIIQELAHRLRAEGYLDALRKDQARSWFWSEVTAALAEVVASDPATAAEAAGLEAAVAAGLTLPNAAARGLIRAFRGLDAGNRPP